MLISVPRAAVPGPCRQVLVVRVYALAEPGVLRDWSSLRPLSGFTVEASLLVREGGHWEGGHVLSAFAAQLAPYARLGRAEASAAAAPQPPPAPATAGRGR